VPDALGQLGLSPKVELELLRVALGDMAERVRNADVPLLAVREKPRVRDTGPGRRERREQLLLHLRRDARSPPLPPKAIPQSGGGLGFRSRNFLRASA
jgi:hypothetical protein